MWAMPYWLPENIRPQTVVPMPSSERSLTTRSASASFALVSAPPRASSICSPASRSPGASGRFSASTRRSSRTATALARSPAAAPPMPSATAIIVGET